MSSVDAGAEPGRLQGEDAPDAANQRTTEPVPPTERHGVPFSSEERADAGAGTSTGPGPREGAVPGAVPEAAFSGGGETYEVPVPSGTPAEGTSEAAPPVEGVRATAVARDGLADGETDNTAPPTGTF